MARGRSSASLLLVMTTPAARAQEETPDYISNVTITSVTIDRSTGVPTMTGTVLCLVDVNFLRIRAILEQRGARSSQTSDVAVCAAGEVESFAIVFSLQLGRFRAGPATLSGFAEAFAACCETASDIDLFPVDRVILRPTRSPE